MDNHQKSRKSFFRQLSNPASISRTWAFLQNKPCGKWLFSKMLGWMIPYTGSISPRVKSIMPGDVVIEVSDRRKIRNHLNSIHAIALANMGEFASGLVLFSKAPENCQAIIVKLEIEYLKKARGNLTAHATLASPDFQNNTELVITTEIKNTANEVVAITHATWRIRLLAMTVTC